LLAEVLPKLDGRVNYEIFGGKNGIWGAKYEQVLANSKMSLNLNRKEGDKWYSSDRIAHLMGYGILTFQSSRNQMERFFTDKETVYFDDAGELADKICYYNEHDDERAAIASAGRRKYHEIFNGARVLKFMVETMTGDKYSEPYEWAEEVYR
jgi:spore maturation protein CgeB